MVESFLRHSPLAHLGLAGRPAQEAEAAAVVMSERPFRGIVNLRGRDGEELFDAAVMAALGLALPVEPNTAATKGKVSVLWLGPDEWWVVGDGPAKGPGLADKLRTALTGQRAAVTEVGESRTCIRISGPRARDALSKGCPLDLHPRNFTAGQCAQSHCAKAQMTLHQLADDAAGPVYDLYVLNSFADYLWRWLEDAAREYGVAVASS